MVTSANPVETTCNPGMPYVDNSLRLHAFSSEHHLVPDDLLRACAAVKASKWEEITVFLGIDDLDEIREFSSSNVTRMFKVLKSWSERAKSPTVGKLLKWFEEVGVNRRLIIMKFEELYG